MITFKYRSCHIMYACPSIRWFVRHENFSAPTQNKHLKFFLKVLLANEHIFYNYLVRLSAGNCFVMDVPVLVLKWHLVDLRYKNVQIKHPDLTKRLILTFLNYSLSSVDP